MGLRDVPGMLVKALEPVSGKGGNIVSVLHSRDKGAFVGVNIVFKVKDQKTLNRILDALKKEGIDIKEVMCEGRHYYSKKTVAFILIGHVIDKDIQDTIDRINEMGHVSDVEVKMSDPEQESAVLMRVDVDEDKKAKLMARLVELSEKKGFKLVREVKA